MIEAGFFPALCIMAFAAVRAKFVFMRILLVVAGIAFGRGITILRLWLVATITFGGAMFILKNKTCFVVFEMRLIEFRKFRVPALMFGMAATALLFLEVPMKPLPAANVLCRFLVAIETQFGLRILIETLVAVLALIFILGVTFDHLARHHRAFYRLSRNPLRQEH